MPFLRLFVLVVVMVVGAGCGDSTEAPPAPAPAPTVAPTRPVTVLPTRDITVTGNGKTEKLIVEMATTNANRTIGLMSRTAMPEDAGMLFLFRNDLSLGFWMHNTLIPLDIAYLDANGKVLEVRQGKPQDDAILTPKQPYRHTLEVNQGWFERHGMGVGSVVSLPPDPPAVE